MVRLCTQMRAIQSPLQSARCGVLVRVVGLKVL